MIRWNIREVNETRNDLSRNTNYAKKRQRRTTRLTRIRKGGIISRETRYTLHGQIESSEGFLSASLRAETHLEGADTYKETWRTTLHVRWIFNRCTSKHTSGLTTSKKILEHCEDWQEGGEEEGGAGGAPVSRYIVASGTFPDALTGHRSMEEKWSRALGLALIDLNSGRNATLIIEKFQVYILLTSYDKWKNVTWGFFSPWIRRTKRYDKKF